MRRIYFDYAATAPIDSAVARAMTPYFSEKFGNPGSLHSFGQEAMAALDESREKIAKSIGADFREIIFTGSATEANNLALRGTLKAFQNCFQKPRIIVSSIEHESILETCRDLEKEGAEIIYLPVNREGFVDLKKLEKSLSENTVLVSVMRANNEIGTIQPIIEISNIIRNFRNSKLQTSNNKQILNFKNQNSKHRDLGFEIWDLPAVYPLTHTDAVQAFQFLDCDVNKLGVDLMTLSAHKIYGPKGAGLLYVKSQIQNSKFQINSKSKIQNSKIWDLGFGDWNLPAVKPLVTGGGQEFGLRSGTENIPAIVGFAKAAELAVQNRKKEAKRINDLAGYFWKRIKKIYPKAKLNNSRGERSPNILNIYFPEQSAEELLIKFDLVGIAVSSGSACSARKPEPSRVLRACGLPLNRIKSSLRISFGKYTTKKEINEAILALSSSPV